MVKCPETVENVILHEYAIVHLADSFKNGLAFGGWKVSQHPPISPDLNPRICGMILRLRGKQFSNRENILTEVRYRVAQVSMLHNDDGVYLLFEHWQLNIDSLKDYFSYC
jgi:hypothetical protein